MPKGFGGSNERSGKFINEEGEGWAPNFGKFRGIPMADIYMIEPTYIEFIVDNIDIPDNVAKYINEFYMGNMY